MAFDEDLADRARPGSLLAGRAGVREQKMFGALCFMLEGNMACGIIGNELMVRVGKENLEDALSQPHSRPFDMAGRPIRSFVYVSSEGLKPTTTVCQPGPGRDLPTQSPSSLFPNRNSFVTLTRLPQKSET